MNERIKELAKQTGYIWHAGGDPQIYEFTPEKLEKFAKLIVRECAKIAWHHTPDTEELEYSHLIKDKILEHFGVKE